ncbi:hypothetical protein C0995_010296 [Termitomyces sp. Mi166|nr:hypothetical protein C0995_010296 [Termitomyces sp. Mi166\
MVQYRIPNLLSHMQGYIKPNNPNNDILAAEHMAWIDACYVVSDAHKTSFSKIESGAFARLPRIFKRSFPVGSVNLGVKLNNGEHTSSDAPATTTQAQKWADIYKQAFRQTLGETEGPGVIIKYFTDQMLNAIKDPYWSYLVNDNILLAEGMVKEAADRENPDTELSLETYMQIRRNTIGARQLFDIGRWIHGIDIAREVMMHPDIVEMEDRFVDLVSLANDLYSYRKEFFARDANHNYITIAFRDPITGLQENDLQGAIDYTYRKFCQVLTDLEYQKQALPSFGESEDAKVAMYVNLMMDVVVGTIQWSLECGRYGHIGVAGTEKVQSWGDVVFEMDPL